MALHIVICIICGYIAGCFSTGYIIGKRKHMDIREHGSGNAGTTNAFRTMGKAAGILTFVGDFLKAYIPLLLIEYVFFKDYDYVRLLMVIFGLACVLGHNFPFWLKFKGGKGIAVTGGVFVGLDPIILGPGVFVFAGLTLLTKYVSVGSLAVSIMFPLWLGFISERNDPYVIPIVCVAICYTISAFYMHRANIVRLINGTENKIGQKKDKQTQESSSESANNN